jgi:hypothetical protein
MLFATYGLFGKRDVETPEKIVVSASRIANLGDGFTRTWKRPPNEEELRGLIEDYIRDEVFYRAGRAAGIDRDDVVIRRRVRQKMEFLAEEISIPELTDAELGAYLASHQERFRAPDSLTFRQVFLSASRRAATIDADAKQLAAALAAAGAEADTAELGDPFLLGTGFRAVPLHDVAQTFGEGFAERAFAAEQGRWQGPIASPFGLHFIFITERTKGSMPPLDTVRPAVARQLAEARRIEAEQKLYQTLRDRYQITVETGPLQTTAAARQ